MQLEAQLNDLVIDFHITGAFLLLLFKLVSLRIAAFHGGVQPRCACRILKVNEQKERKR